MGRQSSIKGLPAEIKATLDRLLRADATTQQEILTLINAELAARGGGPVSRSAMSRYTIQMRAAGAKITQAREVAKVWVGQLGEAPGRRGRAADHRAGAHHGLRRRQHAMDSDDPAAPKLIGALAKSVRYLETAAKISPTARCDPQASGARRRQGGEDRRQGGRAVAETAQQIYDQVLGVRKRAA